jgi:hypothetical protein
LKLTSRIESFVNFKRIKLKMKKKIVIQPNFELNQFYWDEPKRIRFDSFPAMCLVIPLVLHPKVESLKKKLLKRNNFEEGKKIDCWGIWIPLFLTPPTIIGCQDLDIDIGLVMPYWFMFSMYFLVKLYNIFFLKRSEVI